MEGYAAEIVNVASEEVEDAVLDFIKKAVLIFGERIIGIQ